ncbi:MAG: hypothetical protein V2A73_20755 [Pseudomonadota bacterium]
MSSDESHDTNTGMEETNMDSSSPSSPSTPSSAPSETCETGETEVTGETGEKRQRLRVLCENVTETKEGKLLIRICERSYVVGREKTPRYCLVLKVVNQPGEYAVVDAPDRDALTAMYNDAVIAFAASVALRRAAGRCGPRSRKCEDIPLAEIE